MLSHVYNKIPEFYRVSYKYNNILATTAAGFYRKLEMDFFIIFIFIFTVQHLNQLKMHSNIRTRKKNYLEIIEM